MNKTKIPLIILENISLYKPFVGIGSKLASVYKSLAYDLRKAAIELEDKEYFAVSILNSFIYFAFFFIFLFLILFELQNKPLVESAAKAIGLSFAIFVLILIVLISYPKIIAGKRAEQIDRNLVFALKDMMLQIISGVSLFNSMANIANSNYGEASKEFGKAIKYIQSGMSLEHSLQKIAIESNSGYMRRTIWQLVNTIKVGASLKGSLRAIIAELTIEQKDKIKGYAHELNMWILAYMLFAVAVPTIGTTLMIILSAFSGYAITKELFVAFIIINLIIEYILIGFVKYRRPIVSI